MLETGYPVCPGRGAIVVLEISRVPLYICFSGQRNKSTVAKLLWRMREITHPESIVGCPEDYFMTVSEP